MRLCWGYLHHPERASSPQGRTWLCSLLGNRSIWTRRIATQSWQRRSKEAVNCEEMRAVRRRRYEGKPFFEPSLPIPKRPIPSRRIRPINEGAGVGRPSAFLHFVCASLIVGIVAHLAHPGFREEQRRVP